MVCRAFFWVCLFLAGCASLAQDLPYRPAVQLFGEGAGLPSVAVHDLAQDAEGRIWIGTQKGVAWLSRGIFHPTESSLGLGPGFTGRMLANREGVWAGSFMDGLQHLGPKGWKVWREADGKPLGRVIQVLVDAEDRVHVLNAAGRVFRVEGDRLVRPAWAPEAAMTFLLATKGGWLGASHEGLWCQTPDGWKLDSTLRGPVLMLARSQERILVTLARGAWLGTPGAWKPVVGLEGESLHSAAAGPGLGGTDAFWAVSSNRLFCLEGDRVQEVPLGGTEDVRQITAVRVTKAQGQSQIWVTSIHGLFRVQPGGWNALPRDLGPGSTLCYSLARTPDGALWYGDAQGRVHRFLDHRWQVWALGKQDAQSIVFALTPLPGAGNSVLAMLSRGGLYQWDGRAWTFCGWGELKPSTFASALVAGTHLGQAGAWIGTEAGLYFWSQQRGITRVASPDKGIRWVLPDPTRVDHVLVGGMMDEVLRWDGSRFSRVAELPGCRFSVLGAWVPGEEGRAFRVGTYDQGVKTFGPDGHLRAHWCKSSTPAWPGDAILSLAHDAQGRAWVGTDFGMVRMGVNDRIEATYTQADGLPSNLCTNTALLLEGKERVWTGTSKGVAFLPPRENPPVPLPALRLLSAGSGAGSFLPGARLGQPVSQIGFAFELPLLHREGDIRYQLQLEGLGLPAGPWTPDAKVIYPTLPPGSYRLQIRAMAPDGREAGPLVVPFSVAPPFWRHPVLIVLYFLVLASGAVALHRVRLARLRARNRELTEAVDQATHELKTANERLYHLNDEKNRIIGVAAHDLRNPLSGILMSCELLQEELPEAQAPDVVRIRSLGKAMLDLIQGLLDVNAIEAYTAGAPVIRSMDVGAVLEEIQCNYQPKAERKGISLSLEAEVTGPILADERHVQRVLDNLVSNAVKYSPKDRQVWIRLKAHGEWFRFEIQDQGPGLTTEDQARVFGAYARLSARPTAGEPSVGLGLSIVKKLVEDMKGRVGVDSFLGEGATFWVELPRGEG